MRGTALNPEVSSPIPHCILTTGEKKSQHRRLVERRQTSSRKQFSNDISSETVDDSRNESNMVQTWPCDNLTPERRKRKRLMERNKGELKGTKLVYGNKASNVRGMEKTHKLEALISGQ